MILNIANQRLSGDQKNDQTDYVYASAHVAGIGFMFYGAYIGFAYGRISGLWMALLGLIIFRIAREIYLRSLITRALHGKQVAEFMNPQSISIDPTTPLSEIMRRVREDRLVFPVARESDHALLGLVDVRSSEKIPAVEWRSHQVSEITQPCTKDILIEPEEDAELVLARMQTLGVREMLVVKGGRLLGILSLSSLLGRIQDRFALPDSQMRAAT